MVDQKLLASDIALCDSEYETEHKAQAEVIWPGQISCYIHKTLVLLYSKTC